MDDLQLLLHQSYLLACALTFLSPCWLFDCFSRSFASFSAALATYPFNVSSVCFISSNNLSFFLLLFSLVFHIFHSHAWRAFKHPALVNTCAFPVVHFLAFFQNEYCATQIQVVITQLLDFYLMPEMDILLTMLHYLLGYFVDHSDF